jgi:DNA repair protein RadC
VFKACILNNASSVILAHNHPSMNLQPSLTDITLTQLLEKAGMILDIPLLDHIIINQKGNYFSFKESGYLIP